MKKMLVLLLTLCLLAGMVPLGAGAIEPATDGVYEVDSFDDLSAAISVAENGVATTIRLTAGFTVANEINIPSGTNIVLDLNGQKIESTVDGYTLVNNGTLTINDETNNGIVCNTSTAAATNKTHFILRNYGTMTINGGTFGDTDTDRANDNTANWGAAIINLAGTCTINGGYFTCGDNYWSAEPAGANYSYAIRNSDQTATMLFKGGTVYGKMNGGISADSGVITIDDGNFSVSGTTSYYVLVTKMSNGGKIVVNGGTFTKNNYSNDTKNGGLVGGFSGMPSWDAAESLETLEKNGFTITGGTFAMNGESVNLMPIAEVNDKQYFSLNAAITAATENATVKLLKGTTENVTISQDKTLTLDLNGKTLSGSMKVKGNLTIQDSATGGTISNTGNIPVDGGRLTLKSGTISVEDDYGVYVLNGGSATINGGTISSKYSALAGNNTTGDMNFEVTGGTLTAKEGPAIYMPGQITMNISGGTLNGGISLRMGQITISGGTINATNGTIDAPEKFYNYSGNAAFPDALYVLNGTYTSQNATYENSLDLTITGGTFNCANSQGSAVAIYDLGKVAQESKVTISGDAKFSTNAVGRSAYQVLTLSDIGVDSPEGGYNNSDNVGKVSTSITSGYFTSDPSKYCAEGLTGLPGQYVVDGNTYQYMVGKKLENVTVATGETEAKKATGVTMDTVDVEKISKTKADGLTPEANDTAAGLSPEDKATKEKYNAAADTLSEQIPEATSENITTVIAPRLEIEITGYDKGTAEATEKSLTLNIEAVYDIKATTATGDTPMVEYDAETPNASQVNTVTIEKNAGTLNTNGQDVVISIPLPTGFVTSAEKKVYVQHKNTYEYEATVTETGTDPNKTYTATFTNPHGFSTFVLSTEPKAVATVDGTNYTNFQQAVDAAGVNGTVTVQKGGQTATGVTHNLKLENSTSGPITVTINGEKITIPAGETKPFTYTAPTPPRPTEEKHSITISTDGKGQVTGPASAAEDDKVTLTVKPNADKELYDLKVTDEDGKAIAVTKVNDTTYTFTMPDGKVTVAATFGCDGGDNCPSKAFTDLGDKQWYHDFIDYAVENGLLEGTSPTTMEPNATLIRAQLAQILYNIEDKPAVTGEMIFEDVPASEWFYSPVLWANQSEIINGTSPTTFEPLENISRQDLALMLYRYAGKPAVTGDLDGFTDADQVGDWAEEAMAWAVAEGIVQGDTPTTLNPTGTATRAEAAAMLQRFLEDAA